VATHGVQPQGVGLQPRLLAARVVLLLVIRPCLPAQLIAEPPAAEVSGRLGFIGSPPTTQTPAGTSAGEQRPALSVQAGQAGRLTTPAS
jgi:hypothetical protein